MIPENNATNVLHRASFSMSPVEQKKLKPGTPRGLLAIRVSVHKLSIIFYVHSLILVLVLYVTVLENKSIFASMDAIKCKRIA